MKTVGFSGIRTRIIWDHSDQWTFARNLQLFYFRNFIYFCFSRKFMAFKLLMTGFEPRTSVGQKWPVCQLWLYLTLIFRRIIEQLLANCFEKIIILKQNSLFRRRRIDVIRQSNYSSGFTKIYGHTKFSPKCRWPRSLRPYQWIFIGYL